MTYQHHTIHELTMIQSYYLQHNKPHVMDNEID
ncbi:IS30 family transposase, partial [Enterococcus lactis]|nr:IS30 family transposase [Enterococcus lactis]